jgi:hypothetical protein
MTIKTLNSLSYNLAQSYFSTLNYYQKGYMIDWLVNGANDLGIDTVEIDFLDGAIKPNELLDTPLIAFFNYTKQIICKTLESNNLPADFIIEAKFIIKISPDRWITCSNYTKDITGKIYKSKDYIEKSYDVFRVFDPISRRVILEELKPKSSKFKILLNRLFRKIK